MDPGLGVDEVLDLHFSLTTWLTLLRLRRLRC
jgi:hypothetical protein